MTSPSCKPRLALAPVGVLWQGKGEVGELPVSDGLAAAEEAAHHGAGLAAEQLHDDALVPLQVVPPVPVGRRDVALVCAVLLRHCTGSAGRINILRRSLHTISIQVLPEHLVDVIMEPL